jgi:hypothetical protein
VNHNIGRLQEYGHKFQGQNKEFRYLSSDRLISWTRTQNLHYANSHMDSGINIASFEDFKKYSRLRGEVNDAFIFLKDNL